MPLAPTPHRYGRPRAPGRRRDGKHGRSRGESAADVTAIARAQRIKAGADPHDALNALYGSALGILHRRWQCCPTDPGSISDDQFRAAQAYVAIVVRHCEIMGIPLPRPAAATAVGATRADPDDETVLRVRRRFADFRRGLLDAGRELGLGARVNAAVYRVCIEDPPIDAVSPAEIENLRYGLNAIARITR
jgi:hypothetical protein